ncbi:hypothetical protein YC2023_104252 [Brassica napus]
MAAVYWQLYDATDVFLRKHLRMAKVCQRPVTQRSLDEQQSAADPQRPWHTAARLLLIYSRVKPGFVGLTRFEFKLI